MATPYVENGTWGPRTHVLSAGAVSEWDWRLHGMMSPCAVIKLSGTYYVYYIGADSNRGDGGPANRALGVAYGTDPRRLTKYASNPIITFQPNVDEEEGVFSAGAFLEGSTIHMYYGGLRQDNGGVDIEIRYRSSTNGLTFSNDTLIYQSSGQEVTPVGACKVGSTYHVYYLGPLSGGNGNIMRRNGSSATSLPNDTPVSGTNRYGGGDINFRDASTMFTCLVNGDDEGLCYDIDTSAPDTLSSLLETYTDPHKHRAIYLDQSNLRWLVYCREPGDGNDMYLLDSWAVGVIPPSFRP